MQITKKDNISYEIITVIDTPSHLEKEEIAEFVFANQKGLKENKEDVFRCVEFAFGQFNYGGGFVVLARDTQKMNNPLVGCAVVNQTTMKGYVSENLLVYLTVHPDFLTANVNKTLLEQSMQLAKGNIDVHVFLDEENKQLLIENGFILSYQLYRLNRK